MKSKRIVLQVIILSILIVFTTAVSDSTFAIPNQGVEDPKMPEGVKVKDTVSLSWHTCEVRMVGPGWGVNIYLYLKDQANAFTPRWFIARDDQKKEMLATGLTAMSNNIKVRVCLENTAAYSTIIALYLTY